jgi:hypothetical protein
MNRFYRAKITVPGYNFKRCDRANWGIWGSSCDDFAEIGTIGRGYEVEWV